MKRILSVITGMIALSASMALTGLSVAIAQEYENTPITISKEKVKVSGKV